MILTERPLEPRTRHAGGTLAIRGAPLSALDADATNATGRNKRYWNATNATLLDATETERTGHNCYRTHVTGYADATNTKLDWRDANNAHSIRLELTGSYSPAV